METLYIVGDSRSGSTLLQHLLAQRPGVIALGEVRRLQSLFMENALCSCGRPLCQCPFWLGIQSKLHEPLDELRTRPDLPAWRRRYGQVSAMAAMKLGSVPEKGLLSRERTVATCCLEIYRAASDLTGADVLVDSSKVPEQFLYLRLLAGGLVKPIFLLRDGRAVVWSKLKRYPDLSFSRLCWQWRNLALMTLVLRRLLPPDEREFLRYEDLCRSPHQVLRGLTKRLAIPEPAAGSTSSTSDRHDLGGSPSFEGKSEFTVRLDDRWRTEMTSKHLETFDRIAGPLNRKLGYD